MWAIDTYCRFQELQSLYKQLSSNSAQWNLHPGATLKWIHRDHCRWRKVYDKLQGCLRTRNQWFSEHIEHMVSLLTIQDRPFHEPATALSHIKAVQTLLKCAVGVLGVMHGSNQDTMIPHHVTLLSLATCYLWPPVELHQGQTTKRTPPSFFDNVAI